MNISEDTLSVMPTMYQYGSNMEGHTSLSTALVMLVGYCWYYFLLCMSYVCMGGAFIRLHCRNNRVCGNVDSEKLFRQGCTRIQYPI